MKVSIIGNGLTSLTLATTLANLGIRVDILSDQKIKKNNKFQTLGISKSNIDFFNKNILNIKKFLWNINKIEILSENLENKKILDFNNKGNTLFSIVRNFDLYNHLFLNLKKKKKFVKFKKEMKYHTLIKEDYKLIFNCDYDNLIAKKFFHKRIDKDYNSFAHVSILKHKKISNNIASQIFTKKGPLAFLPLSETETSVVYSVKGKKNINFEEMLINLNTKYNILKINKSVSFDLKSSNLRSYYHKNIIAFGDLLHKIHPLAGQGFNMTIRDIQHLIKIIDERVSIGLPVDKTVCKEFENKTKSTNFLFSKGIDFIYSYFNFENRIKTNFLSSTVKLVGKNRKLNEYFRNFADKGIAI